MQGSIPYFFITLFVQGGMCKILHICTYAEFLILALQKCASTKTFCVTPPIHARCKSARSCIFAHVQDFAFLHIEICKFQDIMFSLPTTCKVQSKRSYNLEHVQDFAFLHIKNVQVFKHSVFAFSHIKNVQVQKSYALSTL